MPDTVIRFWHDYWQPWMLNITKSGLPLVPGGLYPLAPVTEKISRRAQQARALLSLSLSLHHSHYLHGLPAHTRRQVSLAAATAPTADTVTHTRTVPHCLHPRHPAPVAVAVAVAMNARVLRTSWRQASAQGWSAARTRVPTWCRRPWQPR